jgi:hypothetical protein
MLAFSVRKFASETSFMPVRRVLLIALTAVCVANPLAAQTSAPGASSAPAATKVGVIDIGAVFAKWEKSSEFKRVISDDLQPLRDKAETIRKLIADWENYFSHPRQVCPGQREAGEHTLADAKRRLKELEDTIRAKMAKHNEDKLVGLYKEINETVGKYARLHGFHLVFAYGEPPEEELLFSSMNISRKKDTIDTGGVVLLFSAGGLDITEPIIDVLNRGDTATLDTSDVPPESYPPDCLTSEIPSCPCEWR